MVQTNTLASSPCAFSQPSLRTAKRLTYTRRQTHTLSQAAPCLSLSHYPISFPFWHYDYGHSVLVYLFRGVPVPLSPGRQLQEGEEIQLFVLQPQCLEQTSRDGVSSGHTHSNLIRVHCPFSTLTLTHSLPPPHSWAPCCQAEGCHTHRERREREADATEAVQGQRQEYQWRQNWEGEKSRRRHLGAVGGQGRELG